MCQGSFEMLRPERMSDYERVQRNRKDTVIIRAFLIHRVELINDHLVEIVAAPAMLKKNRKWAIWRLRFASRKLVSIRMTSSILHKGGS